MRNTVIRAATSLWTSLRAIVVLALILGVLYPAAVWTIGRAVPNNADGSWVRNAQGEIVGSSLIGQAVTDERLFFPRPSAAGAENSANIGDDGYDAMSSGASNLASTSKTLKEQIATRRAAIAARDNIDPATIPADALTASGSGLDPHISPEYAALQIKRVASKTGLTEEKVRQLVADNTTQPHLGFLQEPVVNTVTLNTAVVEAAGINQQ
ncbi:potassium-transporting ATPase subunit KdpC [Pseudoglutamicibacter cumminsii]|uniref:Potassium-transporting ATPase KdpC subunit n=1 Tax=Pseudoglutamicibacter cumminsii TaxID=156979 RepID=A0ABX5L521_9MICC|nr:potassium-transporting ATPase subunit KdpC [Pseudoglutamicibacter cumminsii]PWI27209.1 potassium-transporting ATPase subunit C [Pseudoglutamicibacter cumminsii]